MDRAKYWLIVLESTFKEHYKMAVDGGANVV